MQVGHDSVIVGAACGLASTAVPDGLMNFAGKVLVGVLVAMLSGLAHSAGKALWHKIAPKKHKPEAQEPPPRAGDHLN